MKNIQFPVSTNWIMKDKDETQHVGHICLFENEKIALVSNKCYDENLIIYNEIYENTQANSLYFKEYMYSIADIIIQNTASHSNAIEIGCGQGDFYKILADTHHFNELLGFDAVYKGNCNNIFKRYINDNDRITTDFVILRHVLEHIESPFEYLGMLFKVFGDIPIYIEVPNYEWIKSNQKFCEVFYEHIHYFSLETFNYMFNKIIDCGEIFDKQYIYVIAKLGDLNEVFFQSYQDENLWNELELTRIFPNIDNFFNKLSSTLSNDSNIYIWGASSKACMLLVYASSYGMLDKFPLAVDINPNRWNHYLPFSKVKIINPDELYKKIESSDFILISNPNYYEEISEELNKNGCNNELLIL